MRYYECVECGLLIIGNMKNCPSCHTEIIEIGEDIYIRKLDEREEKSGR